MPQCVFTAPKESVRLFLQALFGGDGGVYHSAGGLYLEYYSKSRRLIEDIHHLHVWQPEEGKTALEGHLAVSEQDFATALELKERIKGRLRERFGVDHAVLELELASHVRHSRELFWQGE